MNKEKHFRRLAIILGVFLLLENLGIFIYLSTVPAIVEHLKAPFLLFSLAVSPFWLYFLSKRLHPSTPHTETVNHTLNGKESFIMKHPSTILSPAQRCTKNWHCPLCGSNRKSLVYGNPAHPTHIRCSVCMLPFTLPLPNMPIVKRRYSPDCTLNSTSFDIWERTFHSFGSDPKAGIKTRRLLTVGQPW